MSFRDKQVSGRPKQYLGGGRWPSRTTWIIQETQEERGWSWHSLQQHHKALAWSHLLGPRNSRKPPGLTTGEMVNCPLSTWKEISITTYTALTAQRYAVSSDRQHGSEVGETGTALRAVRNLNMLIQCKK